MAEDQQRENYSDELFSSRVNEWIDKKENVTIVWLTQTSFFTENPDGTITHNGLKRISSYICIFNEPSVAVKYIKNVRDERIFLIVDGRLFTNVYETACSHQTVDSIYIFCKNRRNYEPPPQHQKFKGIFTNQISLFNALINEVETVEKQILAFTRLNRLQHVVTRNLARESASFFWFMLLFDVLKAMPQATEVERADMLNICTDYYRGNETVLNDIEEFRQNYTADKALDWYTKPSFIYRLVNKALRIEDAKLLYQFRFYIIDLCNQLEQEWHDAQGDGLTEIRSTVFRGGKLKRSEIKSLTLGHLITTNGFLSTTRDIDVARMFVRPSVADDSNYCGVIFDITIPENLTSLIYADVRKHTKILSENEVLFSLGARFRVDNVSIDTENITYIQMTATDDGREDVDQYREVLHRHMTEAKPCFVFGRLLLDMDQREKAKSYFQLLLSTLSIDNHQDIAHTHGYLGRIERENKCLEQALFHHMKALEICREHLPPINELHASFLNSLGLDYYAKSDIRNALNHLYRSLDMKLKLFGENGHTHIARVSGHIAMIFQDYGDFNLALHYLQRALYIEQKFLPCQHIYIAFRLEKLASLYVCQKKYILAFIYYLQALVIVKRRLHAYHNKYILILNGINNVINHLTH